MRTLLSRLFRRPKMFMLHADFLRAFNLPGKLPITLEHRTRAERAGRDTLDERFFNLEFFRDYAPTLNAFLDRFRHDADTPYFLNFRRKLPLLVDGLAHDAGNRIREARECFEAILRLDPADAYALFSVARTHIVSGQYGAAATNLREAVRHYPRFYMALLDLGYTWLESGQAERAKDAFYRIMELSPGDVNAFEGLRRVGEYVAIADAGAPRGGRTFLKREEYRRRLEGDVVRNWENHTILRETGERAFEEGFFTFARRCFERAMILRDDPALQLRIARAWLEEGEPREAYQLLAELPDSLRGEPEALLATAEACHGLGKHADARRHLEAAFDRGLPPGADGRACELMARVHRAASQVAEGFRWLLDFAARHPEAAAPWRAMALHHAARGDAHAACDALRQALNRAPLDESLVADLAMQLGRAGRYEEVVDLLRDRVVPPAADAASPGDAAPSPAVSHVHLWNLSLAYRDLDRRKEAIEMLRKVVSMDVVPQEFKSLARRELDRLFRS